MIVAKVIDNIWSTRKLENLRGLKFMLVEQLASTDSKRFIAIDVIGAGIGERVIIATGSAARRMLEDDSIPIDAAIIGIVDEDCQF